MEVKEIEERRLTIIRAEPYISKSGRKENGYLCRCECGNTKLVRKHDYIKGKVKSCGCLISDFNKTKIGNDYWKYRKPRKKKEKTQKDKDRERLRRIWKNMKQRCYNPNFPDYCRYGARGIRICNEWINNFQAFYEWALSHGYTSNLTIDRVNNNGNYEPNNCQWITSSDQNYNKRTNKYLIYNGISKAKTEWAEILGIKPQSLDYRIRKGLSDEEILLGTRKKTIAKNKAILQKYFNN